MKIGLITDTHLHNWEKFGRDLDDDYGWTRRLKEQVVVIRKAIEIFKEKKVDYFVHAGDWVHSVGSISNEVANALNMILEPLDIPSIVVDGNHDTVVRKNPKTAHIITYLIKELISDLLVYPPEIKIVNYYDEVDYDKIKGYKLVVLHKTPIGSKVGNFTFSEGVDWQTLAKNNDFVAFGHIHQEQILSKNCIIIAPPYHISFADIGDRGIWVLDTKKGFEFIKLNSPKFLTVNYPNEVKQDGNYYRVLNGTKEILDENVIVNVVKPKYYEERIKGNNLYEICEEWLKIKNKDISYLEVIKDIIQEKNANFRKIFKGRIKKVEIKNFISIEDIEYEVKNGFTLVKGINGSGKTNLFDAIYYCFFGKTTKELTNDEVVRWGQKNCEVVVYLEGPNGGLGKIVRTFKEGLHIYKNVNDKDSVTQGLLKDRRQEMLETLLGITEEIFLSSCYFSQENLSMLTQLSDTGKTNIISRLLGFDMYCGLYDKCFIKIKELGIEEEKIKGDSQNLNFTIEKYKSNKEIFKNQIEENNKSILANQKLIVNYQEILNKIVLDIANPNSDLVIEKVVNYDMELTKSQEIIKKITNELHDLENNKEKLEGSNVFLIKEMDNYKNDINHFKADQEELKRQIDTLRSTNITLNEKCDKCGSLIIKENIEIFIKEKLVKMDHLEDKIISLEAKIEDLSNKQIYDILTELKKVQELIFSKKQEIENLREKEKDLNNKKFEQSEKQRKLDWYVQGKLGDQKEYTKSIETYKNRIEELKDKNYNIDQQIQSVEEEILNLENKLLVLSSELILIESNKEKLEFWKEAFSPRGIKSLLLDRFCNEFNSILSDYISSVFSNQISVYLSPTKIIKSGEERNEMSLNVTMLREDKEVNCSYKSLSGGQKRRVDVSLCLSLNKWVSDRYNVPNGLLGLVILDEIFSFLDKEGEESLANLISSESSNKAILVISHTPSLESFATNVWEMGMEDNISKLNF
jgi:DNA repair exonuclease SbcCD ATPase subunit/predicted phosphodiesterase